ncbi:hypothetical protein Bca52824_056471 [Brassica carinata]|uniref:Potassium transporter n=1 Tax=Brassica carinata TaxID=52824 RepID=A0A8X7UDU8_BRACI|nr:hypothetical protein Bca52824_056471 [Brassica carinata]
MDLESLSPRNQLKKETWWSVLTLAYQSLGVVYGDLATSPLYVYKSTFAEDIQHSGTNEEIFGVLSLVFWTLTLIPLLKYGETFALYSLLCRHARISSLPNFQLADEDLSECKKNSADNPRNLKDKGWSLKNTLEKHKVLQNMLLVLALIGTCMVIGDGVLTPAISVFSAVSGLELSMSKEQHQYVEVPVVCAILIVLFSLQHYGTHRLGFLFAPIVLVWLLCISTIGVYNIFHWNPHVYKALPPYYIYKFLKKTRQRGWMSLGGILLCITGSEAIFVKFGFIISPTIELVWRLLPLTTCLMSLVIVLCWRKSTLYALAFIFFFGTIESLYFSASLIKFREGAWVPLALSFIFLFVMYLWHYGTVMRYEFDVQNKVSVNWLLTLFGSSNLGIVRVRGVGVISTELVSGVPAIFSHFVTNLPAFHQVVVFLCVKSVPVPHVKPEERFLVGRVGPKEYRLYRCIARYGYRDVHKDDVEFEQDLVCSIAEFIRSDKAFDYELDPGNESERLTVVAASSSSLEGVQIYEDDCLDEREQWSLRLRVNKRVRFVLPESSRIDRSAEEELTELTEAREAGWPKAGSSVVKKMAINFGYDFLRRNSRGLCYGLSTPHASTLEVGMVYIVCSCFCFVLGTEIVSGLVTNVASMLWKWLWSLQTSTTTTAATKSGVSSRSMVKYESGYNIETVFDGNKLGIEPYAVEVSPSGEELIVLDSENSNIHKISMPLSRYGKPKLVSGSQEGYTGHVDGKLKEAKMNRPRGLAIDDSGNIYVADTNNMAIRKISDAGVSTIATGGRFSDDFDLIYVSSTCSLLVIDRGNQVIREIQLHDHDCSHHEPETDLHLGTALLVAAAFFGYMFALLVRRVRSLFSSFGNNNKRHVAKPNMTMAPYQRYPRPVRQPLIPPQYEPENEEGFIGSLGKLVVKTGSSVSEMMTGPRKVTPQDFHYHHPQQPNQWPVQESFAIPEEDGPPALEPRSGSNPDKPYLRAQGTNQNWSYYQDCDQYQNQKKRNVNNTDDNRENEIVFGAVQEQDGRREAMVIKAVDFKEVMNDQRNIRPRINYMGYSSQVY